MQVLKYTNLNRVQLNTIKTKLIWCERIDAAAVTSLFGTVFIVTASVARFPGVYIDGAMSLRPATPCFGPLRQIQSVKAITRVRCRLIILCIILVTRCLQCDIDFSQYIMPLSLSLLTASHNWLAIQTVAVCMMPLQIANFNLIFSLRIFMKLTRNKSRDWCVIWQFIITFKSHKILRHYIVIAHRRTTDYRICQKCRKRPDKPSAAQYNKLCLPQGGSTRK